MVDLAVLHCSPSVGSLSEVQALVAGKPNMTRAEEAMELYHIALFLEFNMLAQGNEILIFNFNLDLWNCTFVCQIESTTIMFHDFSVWDVTESVFSNL